MSQARQGWRRLRLSGALLLALACAVRGGGAAAGPQTETVQLLYGCNNVALTWPTGTPAATVAAAVAPASVLVSMWRFESAGQRFQGFAPSAPQASDLPPVRRLDPAFVCVSKAATLTRPLMVPAGP